MAAIAMATLQSPASQAAGFADKLPDRALIEQSITSALQNKSRQQKGASSNFDKFGSFLRPIAKQRGAAGIAKQIPVLESAFVRVRNGNSVQAYITLAKLDDTEIQSLANSGLDIEVVNPGLKKVQGWIDIDALIELSNDVNVIRINAPRYGHSRAGSVTTEGDSILKANQLRARGFTGKGVKVGIVSDGSNNWTSARNTGDLPSNLVRYGSCSARGAQPQQCIRAKTCNEGTAMAEIIHDIAPDAELAVGSASTSLEFIQRINQLATAFDADIIVDDLGFYGEPYFEDGDIADAVTALPGDVLYVSSAGNSANGHYEDNYRNITVNQLDLHDFGTQAGQATQESIGFIAPARDGVLTLLQWNDRFTSSGNDYDLFVINEQGNVLSSTLDQTSGADAIEGICSFNASSADEAHFAFVSRFSGASKRLEMFFLGSRGVQFNNPSGSIFGHAGVQRVVAVGTINASEPGNNNIAFYSSRGPARVDFPSFRNRRKPDVIGIDGVRVTGAGGFPSRFFGTSAAAPHVAGIAAQLISSRFKVNTNDVIDVLKSTATDLGAGGFDSVYGFGRVDAVRAEAALKGGNPIPAILLLLLGID